MSKTVDTKEKCRLNQTKFSFGGTSAIVTILGLIIGLDGTANPKVAIIGGILVIALADNISDSLGIHIFQESECVDKKEVWLSTFTNFFTRLFVSLSFVALIALLPLNLAVPCSVIWGMGLLAAISYTIAKGRGLNPYPAILEHFSIAIAVIIASEFVGKWLINRF
jgi:VIT1/CCC1 family predicted Fe2+/Mn2+ transporter